jgi:four helix bundle protein
LAFTVFEITSYFPKFELFSLTSQLRRAALSVPTNIVEGYAHNSKAEFKRFIIIAFGSLAETKYLLDVAYRLHYLINKKNEQVIGLSEEVGRMLWKFYRSLV